eukprot:TRINITY_DN6081_c0_g1_i1.p1 TRINITY_DN6081_c0_g1~~TRINITY_DN6081_c0_g1_i1.p1  ORF type:complete len:410 (+),score=168.44 TRINITY_DN6081_c0_g1_i1:76-1230(+)
MPTVRLQPALPTGARACPLQGDHISIVGYDKGRSEEGPISTTHLLYIIEVSWGSGSPWQLRKRYTDFEEFHKRLLYHFGPKQVPYLTGKKKLPVGQTSPKFAEKRTRKLQNYLREVCDSMYSWFLMSDDVPKGPGEEIGVSPLFFEFFEFATYAQIPTPAAPDLSPRRVVKARQVGKSVLLPLMCGTDFESLLAAVRAHDLSEDDDKVHTFASGVSAMRAQGKCVDINCVQGRSIIDEVFFSDVRVEMCREVVPLIQDPENKRRLLDGIDFDDDLVVVERLFGKLEADRFKRDAEPDACTAASGAAGERCRVLLADIGGLDAVLERYEEWMGRLETGFCEDEADGDEEVTVDWVRARWAPSAPGHAALQAYLTRMIEEGVLDDG